MRVSEVYGLTWDCIDFENKTLTINKNIIKKNQYGLPKRKNITKDILLEFGIMEIAKILKAKELYR